MSFDSSGNTAPPGERVKLLHATAAELLRDFKNIAMRTDDTAFGGPAPPTSPPALGPSATDDKGMSSDDSTSAKEDIEKAEKRSPQIASSLRAPAPVYTISERSYLSFETQLTSLVTQLDELLVNVGSQQRDPIMTPPAARENPFSVSGVADNDEGGSLGGTMSEALPPAAARQRSLSVVRFADGKHTGADDNTGALSISQDSPGEAGNNSFSDAFGGRRVAPPPPMLELKPEDAVTVGGLFASPRDHIDNDIAGAYSPVGAYRLSMDINTITPTAGAGAVASPVRSRARSNSMMSVFSLDDNGDASPFSPPQLATGPGGVRQRAISVDFGVLQSALSPLQGLRRTSVDSMGSDGRVASDGGSRRESVDGNFATPRAVNAPDPFVLSPRGRSDNPMADTGEVEERLAVLAQRFPSLVIRHEAQDENNPTLSLVRNVNASGFSVIDFALHIYERNEAAKATAVPNASAGVDTHPPIGDIPRVTSLVIREGTHDASAPTSPTRVPHTASSATLKAHGSMTSLRAAIQHAETAESTSGSRAVSPQGNESTPPPAEVANASHVASDTPKSAAASRDAPSPDAAFRRAGSSMHRIGSGPGVSVVTLTLWQVFVDSCLSIFLQYRFVNEFGFDLANFVQYLDAVFWLHSVKEGYHGSLKTIDALHAAHVVISQPSVNRYLQDVDLFATLVATLTMDIGHLGVTNEFLVRTAHPITSLYGVASPMENLSASLSVALLRDPRLKFLSDEWLSSAPHSHTDGMIGARTNDVVLSDLVMQLIVATSPNAHLGVLQPLQQVFRLAGQQIGAQSAARAGAGRRRGSGPTTSSSGVVLNDSLAGFNMDTSTPTPTSAAAGRDAGSGVSPRDAEWLSAVRQTDIPVVLQAIVRLADASYTLREVPVFYQWVDNSVVEYRRQNDEEVRRGIQETLAARIEPNPFEYHYRLMGMVVGPLVDALPIVPHDFRRCIKTNVRTCSESTADEAQETLPGMQGPVGRYEDTSRFVLSLIKQTSPFASVLLGLAPKPGVGGVSSMASSVNGGVPPTAEPGARRGSNRSPADAPVGSGARAAEILSPNRSSKSTTVTLPDPADSDPTHNARRTSTSAGNAAAATGTASLMDADLSAVHVMQILRLLTGHVTQLASGRNGHRAHFDDAFAVDLVKYLYTSAPELLGTSGASGTKPTTPISPPLATLAEDLVKPSLGRRHSSLRGAQPRSYMEYAAVAREIMRTAESSGWFAAATGNQGRPTAPAYMLPTSSPNPCVAWILKLWTAIRGTMVVNPAPSTDGTPALSLRSAQTGAAGATPVLHGDGGKPPQTVALPAAAVSEAVLNRVDKAADVPEPTTAEAVPGTAVDDTTVPEPSPPREPSPPGERPKSPPRPGAAGRVATSVQTPAVASRFASSAPDAYASTPNPPHVGIAKPSRSPYTLGRR